MRQRIRNIKVEKYSRSFGFNFKKFLLFPLCPKSHGEKFDSAISRQGRVKKSERGRGGTCR